MNWAWQVELQPTPKLVLMALADIADDVGICWPGQHRLAVKCSITVRTLQRILVILQSKGLLLTEPRFRNDGARTSNKYKLALDTPHDKLSGEGVMGDRGPPTPVSPPPDTSVVVTTTEPPSEPSQPPPALPGRQLKGCATANVGGGDNLIFPKALTQPQRMALYGQLATLTPALAQEALDELAGRMAIATVRNPLRYCATLVARLQRGRFSPELGIAIAEGRKAADALRAALAQTNEAALAKTKLSTTPLPDDLREAVARLRARAAARHAGVQGEIPNETDGKDREGG